MNTHETVARMDELSEEISIAKIYQELLAVKISRTKVGTAWHTRYCNMARGWSEARARYEAERRELAATLITPAHA